MIDAVLTHCYGHIILLCIVMAR